MLARCHAIHFIFHFGCLDFRGGVGTAPAHSS
jgi:hypothetical protein